MIGTISSTSITIATAEATGRLVLDAARHLGVRITPEIARPLFAAVATDTGWFRFNSTTGTTYRAGAELVDAGAVPSEIYAALYEQDSLPRLKLRGRILARTQTEMNGRLAHTAALKKAGIATIDLLVVNLYPFQATVADPDCRLDDAIENIDIGGPAMLRAAAKNHASVAVVVDPADYAAVADELERTGAIGAATRLALARKVFAHTARYDGAIANYLTALDADGARGAFPAVLTRQWVKVQQMRYGENPHQQAAFYREREVAPGLLAGYSQLQGKELSYNNIADADAAWDCARGFDAPACVIVKHANPCGVATGDDPAEAYAKAFRTDPTSAFGGIIAFNRAVDGAAAALHEREPQAVAGELALVHPLPEASLDALAHRFRLELEQRAELAKEQRVVVKGEHVAQVEDDGVDHRSSLRERPSTTFEPRRLGPSPMGSGHWECSRQVRHAFPPQTFS